MFTGGQHQSVRRYMSAGSIPIAQTPRLSALSPLYPLPSSPTAVVSSAVVDDAIGDLFTRYLPLFFDLLEKFQYQKALEILEEEQETQWKEWEAFQVMLKLGASCESTYHLMKYLEAKLVETDTIEHMYDKLVVLMNHLADELKPVAMRQGRRCSMNPLTPSRGAGNMDGFADQSRQGEGGDAIEQETDSARMMEINVCGNLSYYIELLEQGAEFFSLRAPVIQIYRGLALSSVPRDYHGILKQIDALLLSVDSFSHPLLETMKQSTIEELSTVKGALQCELRVAEYDFTRSIVALHRLKAQLRSWSDHIDVVSDYPLFEGSGVDFGAGGDEEGLLYDESDENYGITSDSLHSSSSFQSCPPLPRCHVRNSSFGGDLRNVGISSSLVESLASYCGGRFTNLGDTFNEVEDETVVPEVDQSGASLDDDSSPVSSDKPGDPYVSSGDTNSSMPTNALEQAILAAGGNGSGGAAGTSLGPSQGFLNGGGVVGGSTNPVAAEMMASSIKNQEREDGFALPVFQWAKRFYRSLVAKFTLFFHRWLEPFEKKTDYLALELSRYIKTPLGISYLQLMDVLLSRSSHKGDGSKLYIMLILETQALENKGAHYYDNGYRCPSSSNAIYTCTDEEEEAEQQDAKHRTIASSSSADTSGISNRIIAPSVDGRAVRTNGCRPSIDQHTSNALFLRVDREDHEEQNDFSELRGLRSWPAVFCYPGGSSPPLNHWPNIVSLIMDNRSSLDSVRPVFMHFERRQKTTYHIARVDVAMYLVVLAEGLKKSNEKVTQDFVQIVAENLQHSGAFAPRLFASGAPTSA
ncbi:unnamed protein product [Hyaloperonospora brassicae]|uniref:Uncharacterized protein n=1 Tax=Hyaloperonospora brassicae TaxID=162125 RepID=A0AAV0TW72_HYABA|nr:unnamed protein product [Hyaloperonospora brassicae]